MNSQRFIKDINSVLLPQWFRCKATFFLEICRRQTWATNWSHLYVSKMFNGRPRKYILSQSGIKNLSFVHCVNYLKKFSITISEPIKPRTKVGSTWNIHEREPTSRIRIINFKITHLRLQKFNTAASILIWVCWRQNVVLLTLLGKKSLEIKVIL